MTTIVLYGPAGWFVEWYRDDDGGSGYGDNAEVCYWYGTREQCEARAKRPPKESWWVPAGSSDGAPPYDAATATGMYDRW